MSRSEQGRFELRTAPRAAPEEGEVSRVSLLLGRASRGEEGALSQVFEVAYAELCALARTRLRRSGQGACDGLESGLVHEVFLRLAQRGQLQAQHRPHFFKYAGRVMSSVIVDQVRQRSALRRGGSEPRALSWEEELIGSAEDALLLRLHEALEALEAREPELAEIVQMRFFAGLSEAELAEALEVSDRTVRRRWERARLFLQEWLRPH
jgi:RNA polymerase sigma factor (TIGR02999 family)